MTKVFLHTHNAGKADWDNTFVEFSRLPVVGEYVCPKMGADWFEVQLVVHAPFPEGDCEAEVYAVKVDHLEVMKQKCKYDD